LTRGIEFMQIDNWFDFDTNPLYAIMHESIYCQVFMTTSFRHYHSVKMSFNDAVYLFATYYHKIDADLSFHAALY